MPPSKSGIADYSEALVTELRKVADVELFDSEAAARKFDARSEAAAFDAVLYHIGNNPCHDFVYETALRHPGFVVMHEANLHHLVAHLTITRDDWEGYLAECEFNGGSAALAFAERVRSLEVGPDYEGLPMTKRLLGASKAVIVHSHFVERMVRQQGFEGPIAVIPHGVWLPATNRNATRQSLGLDESAPLIGAFGFIKPYKRIAESLRALRRLVRVEPRARMILVGEPHPEFPVDQIIRSLGLREHVRLIGHADIDRFVQLMGACDIILNLRFPTVGETSGSLQRALGLGKAVIVSDVGSFSELPDDICLKVAPGAGEEDLIFEFLDLLVSNPYIAHAMGKSAKDWASRECNRTTVAERYLSFLQDPSAEPAPRTTPAPSRAAAEGPPIALESITTWVAPDAQGYAAAHKTRFVHTLEITPPGDESKSVLEMGAYMQITAPLKFQLGYGTVRGCYYGPAGRTDHKVITSESGQIFECDIDLFDAEKDPYPYTDGSFDTVLCCELIEHLFEDPMHMMSEINRILKPGGHLVLTTPNIGSLRSVSAILLGYHPAFFPAYIRPRVEGEEAEARHNREYVPMEVQHLLTDSGFEIVLLETGEILDEPNNNLT